MGSHSSIIVGGVLYILGLELCEVVHLVKIYIGRTLHKKLQ